MNNLKTKSGFTLIELLMVISIITLLSSVLFSYVGSARAKSRDAVRLSDMKQIGIAANLYYEDKGVLPSSIGTGGDSLVGAGYLSAEPKDPKTGQSYTFTTGNEGKTILVSGNFESDNQILAIAVGDTSNSVLCSQAFASSTGCSSDGIISGNIVGVTVGHRNGGGSGSEVVDSISGCSIEDINKTCPTTLYTNNCYCGGVIKNVDSSLPESECKTEYGLYWDTTENPVRCFDQIACESELRVWSNGVCLQPVLTKDDYLTQTTCIENGGEWFTYSSGRNECLIFWPDPIQCVASGGISTGYCPSCIPGNFCVMSLCQCLFDNGIPLPPATCSSFTYSDWSICSGGIQTRAIITSSPSGCIGGYPITSQSCRSSSLEWSSIFSADVLNSLVGSSASITCSNQLTNGGYTRLPTIDELSNALTVQFITGGNIKIGGFSSGTKYWSSTQVSPLSNNYYYGFYDSVSKTVKTLSQDYRTATPFRCVR